MPNTSIEDQAYPAASGSTASAGAAGFDWGSFAGTVIVFLLILWLAFWVLKRLKVASSPGVNNNWARVIDRQVVSGQQALYLVEVAGQLQVLAGSEHSLVKIADIDDPRVAAEILNGLANRPTEKVEGFFHTVKRKLLQPQKSKATFSSELDRLLEEVDR